MIQSSDKMKKVAGIGLGLVATTVVLLAVAMVMSRGDSAATKEFLRSSTTLSQAVAALSSDPNRAQSLAQSAPGTPGSKVVMAQAQALLPVADQIKARAAALASLEQGLAQLQSTAAAAAQSKFLSSGPWSQALSPLLSEAARPEVQGLAGMFASGRVAQAMTQWSGRFNQFSAEANRLAEIGARDRTMPAADQQQIQALAEASGTVDAAMKVLLPLSGVSAQVVAATALAVPALAQPAPAPPSSLASVLVMASLLPILGALGCLVMLLLAAREVRVQVDTIINNSKQSSKNVQATTRLLDKIHSLVPSGGAVYLDEHMVEPADSPMFPVASAFNRLIDVAATHRDQSRNLQSSHAARDREFRQEVVRVSGNVEDLNAMVGDLSSRLLQQARVVAGLSEGATRQASASSHHADTARNSSSSLQSAILRLEATRSTNQEASKRIKRMGESSQAIELASNRLQSMHQQVKVVAANIATAAAARGSDGRDFMVLADHVQRLVHAGMEVSQDIGQIIDLMKSDASAITSGMERSIADHVDGGRALETASGLLLDIERALPDLSGNASHSVSGLEAHALALSDVASQLSSMRMVIEKSGQSLARLGQSLDSSGDASPVITT